MSKNDVIMSLRRGLGEFEETYFLTLSCKWFGNNLLSAFLFSYLLLSCTGEEDPVPSAPEETIKPVKDEMKPVLLSHDFAFDSIKLTFTEPIKLLFVKSVYNAPYDVNILDPSQIKYSEDGASIKFRCTPCQLGCNYEFEYSVKDTAENKSQQPFVVKYYSGKVKFPGRISHYVVDDERSVAYVLSQMPAKLFVVSLADYEIIDEATLDFLPSFDASWGEWWRITRNPFNGYFYLCSSYSKTIFVYSLEEKRLIKTFELPPEDLFMPEYSSVYPTSMAFTSSGTGLIICYNQWGNGDLLRIINSAMDDATQVVEQEISSLMYSVKPNGDYSKVFLISHHAPFYYFDGKTNSLSQFLVTNAETNFSFFMPNRKNDMVYMSGHQAQFIVNPFTDMRSASSYIGLPQTGDFSYAPGEESDFGYLVDVSNLWLLNYRERKTEFRLMIYDITNIKNLINTVDGQTMIMQHDDELYLINLLKLRRKNL